MDQHSFRRTLSAKNEQQKEYFRAIKEYDVIVASGAAGTGKTYIACYEAAIAYERGQFGKIVIIRPAVATESLGFLPGTFEEKLDPYLVPVIETLKERLSDRVIQKLLKEGELEVAALAFMRGRTFHNSFIILDEAQNTTISQMKLFLTRLGENVKCIITGDPTQSDLNDKDNGLIWIQRQLKNCPSIKFIHFELTDVVRSRLAQEIMEFMDERSTTGFGHSST